MEITPIKRLRMEIDLVERDCTPLPAAQHYRFLPWHNFLLDSFTTAHYLSFRDSSDLRVFPDMAQYDGCRRLMTLIANHPGFEPNATWLAISRSDLTGDDSRRIGRNGRTTPSREHFLCCGMIQSMVDASGFGAIQNLGVAPEHRCRGLATRLIQYALFALSRKGLRRAYLEVSVDNVAAIRLYDGLGFIPTQINYVGYTTLPADGNTTHDAKPDVGGEAKAGDAETSTNSKSKSSGESSKYSPSNLSVSL
jgi:ribosomal protein S18 acetylase RimI-like enzyme